VTACSIIYERCALAIVIPVKEAEEFLPQVLAAKISMYFRYS
jgi:hypothetical protein